MKCIHYLWDPHHCISRRFLDAYELEKEAGGREEEEDGGGGR